MSKFTKQVIYDSFLRFLTVKPLDQITVKEIVEDCGINRKTFYYYFEDIYALANEILISHLEQLQELMPAEPYPWKDTFITVAQYIYDNHKLAEHVFHAMGYEKTEKYFYSLCQKYLPERIKLDATGLNVSEQDVMLITEYAAVMISSVFTRWIDEGIKTVPTEVFNRFFAISDGAGRFMLENAARLNNDIKGSGG